MKSSVLIAISIIAGSATAAQAQTAGNLLGAPLAAGGNLVSGAAAAHAGIAPVVNQASPTAEPLTDGVTNALAAAGAGVSGTGGQVQGRGVRVGSTTTGQSIVSVGTTQTANQGRAVALLNGHH